MTLHLSSLLLRTAGYVGVYKCEGVSSTEGGEVGVLEFWGTGDYIAGSGPE